MSSYDPDEEALFVKHLAVEGNVVSRLNDLLGRDIVGLPTPVSEELYLRMISEIVRKAPDLHKTTFGAVPKPVSKAIQKVFGIDHFIGLALTAGDRLMATAVIVIPSGHASPSDEVLHVFARVAATSLLQRQVEEILRQSEERYRAVSELASDFAYAFYVEPDGTLVREWMTEAFTSITGYNPEAVDARDGWFSLVHPDDVPVAFERVKNVLSGQPDVNELRIITRHGESRWLLVQSRPVWDEAQGRVVRFYGAASDITERKLAEEALQQSARQLEMQNAELDAFAHTVAHDLKNPLALIIGNAAFAEQELATITPAELRQVIETILRSGHRLDRIIDELLLMASVRMADVSLTPLLMGEIVQEACDSLQLMVQQRQADVVIPDPSAWPVALGHEPWIEVVWANYISNALKYGGKPPRVELGWDMYADDIPFVRFWVRDNGPGLSPEAQTKLFAPFTRLDQMRVAGHGLGLSITQRIMARLGGEVGVESREGQGSTFWFTLPSSESVSSPS